MTHLNVEWSVWTTIGPILDDRLKEKNPETLKGCEAETCWPGIDATLLGCQDDYDIVVSDLFSIIRSEKYTHKNTILYLYVEKITP